MEYLSVDSLSLSVTGSIIYKTNQCNFIGNFCIFSNEKMKLLFRGSIFLNLEHLGVVFLQSVANDKSASQTENFVASIWRFLHFKTPTKRGIRTQRLPGTVCQRILRSQKYRTFNDGGNIS